ncbi:hypothetical protein HN873_066496 [Arachis hypogaea]
MAFSCVRNCRTHPCFVAPLQPLHAVQFRRTSIVLLSASLLKHSPPFNPLRGPPKSPLVSGASTGSGQYFMDLQTRSPPQSLLLVADTGSDLVWVKDFSFGCEFRVSGPSVTGASFNAAQGVLGLGRVRLPPVEGANLGFDLCVNVTGTGKVKLPKLSFSFAGKSVMSPPAKNYFIEAAEGVKCVAIQAVKEETFTSLQNLTTVSLKSNYFSGRVPSGFNFTEVLDLSSNLLNGSLPNEFGGANLRYLNLSYNKVLGTILQTFARHIPGNTTIDLSFNNLTSPIPDSSALLNQKTESLSGNADLCGKPLKILCSIPSTLSDPPTNATTFSPAIAAIPKIIDTTPPTNATEESNNVSPSGLKPATIAAIVVGDLAGMAILALIILLVYQKRKKRDPNPTNNSVNKDEIIITK